jgi:hypothetical protein
VENYRAIWIDSRAYNVKLVESYIGKDGIPEHVHYQAVINLLLGTDEYVSTIRGAASYLYSQLTSDEYPVDEFIELVEYQITAASALADCVRKKGSKRAISIELSRGTYSLLVDVAQLRMESDQSGDSTDSIRVFFDGRRYAESPTDSTLLAIYHGSIQMAKSLQASSAAKQRREP